MTVNEAALEVLKVGTTALVLAAVVEHPDFLAKELAHCTGLSAGTVSSHLNRLANAGLITRTRRSGPIFNRATEAGAQVLRAVRQPAGGAE